MRGAPGPPCYRLILALDIEDSTTRTNTEKACLREVMYELLEDALQAGGVTAAHRDRFYDRGDGVLVLIRPSDELPKTRLLDTVIPQLSSSLALHALQRPDEQFRLRAVVHAGEVHFDCRGCYGEALDVAFRLLDAPAVKYQLGQTTASVALVVSEDIYRSVVRHGYDGIDDRCFQPLVEVTVARMPCRGWVHTPGEDSWQYGVLEGVSRTPEQRPVTT